MTYQHSKRRIRGFTLIEVMVALVVISVGLLGIAKMQALALSNTGSARMRSIAALEAASLAAALHADRAYWSALTNAKISPFTVSISSATTGGKTVGTISSPGDATLAAAQSCITASPAACTTAQMAGYDLQDWVNGTTGQTAGLVQQLPTPSSTIKCWLETLTSPLACSILITWTETVVADNTNNNNSKPTETVNYTLYVQP